MVKEIRKRSRQNKQYRQNNRKKWYGMILLAVMLGCTVTACQKTPDQAPVVNKSEGLPKGCIIDKVKDGELKQIDAPEHWKEWAAPRMIQIWEAGLMVSVVGFAAAAAFVITMERRLKDA